MPNSHSPKMLLIGSPDPEKDLRAVVLRDHGIEVDVVARVADAQALWWPDAYRLVLVDVRRHLPGEIVDFCERVRREYPQQRIAYLVGPPKYLVSTWPEGIAQAEKPPQKEGRADKEERSAPEASAEQEEWAARHSSAA